MFFKWNDFEILVFPLLLDRHEDGLVLGLSVGVVNNSAHLSTQVLDVVLSKVYDRECVGVLKMRRLQQVKQLVPVSLLQSVLIHIFNEFDYDRCVFNLGVDGSRDRLCLVCNDFRLFALVSDEPSNFADGFEDNLKIKLQEGCCEASLSLLRPIK